MPCESTHRSCWQSFQWKWSLSWPAPALAAFRPLQVLLPLTRALLPMKNIWCVSCFFTSFFFIFFHLSRFLHIFCCSYLQWGFILFLYRAVLMYQALRSMRVRTRHLSLATGRLRNRLPYISSESWYEYMSYQVFVRHNFCENHLVLRNCVHVFGSVFTPFLIQDIKWNKNNRLWSIVRILYSNCFQHFKLHTSLQLWVFYCVFRVKRRSRQYLRAWGRKTAAARGG